MDPLLLDKTGNEIDRNLQEITMKLTLAAGALPKDAEQTRSLSHALTAKRLVEAKVKEMQGMDNTPKDLAPELGKVAVDEQKFSGTERSWGMLRKDRLTGAAEFDANQQVKTLHLQSEDDDKAYRFQRMEDGSKAYGAPIPGDDLNKHQIVIERPDGSLFMDTTSASGMDRELEWAIADLQSEKQPAKSFPEKSWSSKRRPQSTGQLGESSQPQSTQVPAKGEAQFRLPTSLADQAHSPEPTQFLMADGSKA
jgi:hypothetical protein